jgi:hypothetical protein
MWCRRAHGTPRAPAYGWQPTFSAFDLLWCDGPLTARTYEKRRAQLETLDFMGSSWCTVPRWPATEAVELFRACDDLTHLAGNLGAGCQASGQGRRDRGPR